MFRIKRVYDEPGPRDGRRILVDRLWPRGLSKEKARIEAWMRELAPSAALRKWFGHDPAKWAEFRRRYAAELRACEEPLARLRAMGRAGTVTLLYAAKDERHNNAAALKAILEGR